VRLLLAGSVLLERYGYLAPASPGMKSDQTVKSFIRRGARTLNYLSVEVRSSRAQPNGSLGSMTRIQNPSRSSSDVLGSSRWC
jgi:hypothetical protein